TRPARPVDRWPRGSLDSGPIDEDERLGGGEGLELHECGGAAELDGQALPDRVRSGRSRRGRLRRVRHDLEEGVRAAIETRVDDDLTAAGRGAMAVHDAEGLLVVEHA